MPTAIPILLYHSVSDSAPGKFGPFTVSRSQFASHLDHLAARGVSTLTVGQMLEQISVRGHMPDRLAVITVDDGFADFHTNAWPEMRDRGMKATLYMTAGMLGGYSHWLADLGAGNIPMLGNEQLIELAAEGCEIGSHSMSHPQLDCLPLRHAAYEIEQSKDVLEQILGQSVDSFAYPHGYHDRNIRQLVVDAGYSSASAVREALSHTDDDRFALARVTVKSDFGIDQIDRVITGRGIAFARRRELIRTRIWRRVRRRQFRRQRVETLRGKTA
jgi:peptidoglycan/xylan/chitin deacetylase (PgdA/CDA1 family)